VDLTAPSHVKVHAMTDSTQRVLETALRLPPQERVALAHRLWESVDDAESEAISAEEWDAAWSDEIARRIEESDQGSVPSIPWETVKQRLGIVQNGSATD
jgi:putative addiction module component (TIGR02574 family)